MILTYHTKRVEEIDHKSYKFHIILILAEDASKAE